MTIRENTFSNAIKEIENGIGEYRTFEELKNNLNWTHAVIVFTEDTWEKKYPLRSRCYMIDSRCRYFLAKEKDENEECPLYGGAMDGCHSGVRMDWILEDKDWKIEKIYIYN